MDYYGKRLASCSSDGTIQIIDVSGDAAPVTLRGYDYFDLAEQWMRPSFLNRFQNKQHNTGTWCFFSDE